jgi:hypothetical protein
LLCASNRRATRLSCFSSWQEGSLQVCVLCHVRFDPVLLTCTWQH